MHSIAYNSLGLLLLCVCFTDTGVDADPVVLTPGPTATLAENDTLTLTCVYTASAASNATLCRWRKDDKVFLSRRYPECESYQFSPSGYTDSCAMNGDNYTFTLTTPALTLKDSGQTWQCAVDNGVSSELLVSGVTTVTVLAQGPAAVSAVRLSGGRTRAEGRVEIFHNGTWGTICDDVVDRNFAKVICRMLGYQTTHVRLMMGAFYGPGSGQIWLDDVDCAGYETSVDMCSARPWGQNDCVHSEDVGVKCDVTTAQIRLVPRSGDGVNAGRLEIFYNNTWGTVCDDYFGSTAAAVVCHMLGFPRSGAMAISQAYFGQGSGPIFLDGVSCQGSEESILECYTARWGYHNCNHSQDVGVICQSLTTAQIRLVPRSGDGPNAGRLEIFYNNTWGTVCDDNFGSAAAGVVCHMMGFPRSGAMAKSRAYFGPGSGPIFLDDVSCQGSEESILECYTARWGYHNCNHSEDVGVICQSSPARIETTPVTPSTMPTRTPTTIPTTITPMRTTMLTTAVPTTEPTNETTMILPSVVQAKTGTMITSTQSQKPLQSPKTEIKPTTSAFQKPIHGCSSVDLVIILYASSFEPLETFDKMLNFTSDLVNATDIDNGSDRVGLLVYDESLEMKGFLLNRFSTKRDILEAIESNSFYEESTDTASALRTTRIDIFTTKNGDRPDVRNIVILISQTVSTVNAHKTLPETKALHESGAHVYTIGIDLDDTSEVKTIATPPATNNSFLVDDYDGLTGVAGKIRADMCKEPVQECSSMIDLVIIMDISRDSSILLEHMRDFVANLVHSSDIDDGNIRVAVVTYSLTANVQFHLNTYSTTREILEAIEFISDMLDTSDGFTNIVGALKTIRTHMFTTDNGDRPNIQNVAILVKNFSTILTSDRMVPEALALHESGVHVYTIGIDLNDTSDFAAISTPPATSNSFHIDDYDGLTDLPGTIRADMCKGTIDFMGSQCTGLPDVQHATSNISSSGPFSDGTVLKFTCNTGYKEYGTTSAYTCKGSSWTGGDYMCNLIHCPRIDPPDNGRITNSPDFAAGSLVIISCNTGYEINGASTLTCRTDGQWRPVSPPTCNPKMCPDFGSILNANIFQEAIDGVQNDYGSVVRVTCKSNYILVGKTLVKCLATGQWEEKPTCQPVTCPPLAGANSSCIDTAVFYSPNMYILLCSDDSDTVSVTKIGSENGDTICKNNAWSQPEPACYCDCLMNRNVPYVSMNNLVKSKFLKHGETLIWSCTNGTNKVTHEDVMCTDGRLSVEPMCTPPVTSTTSVTTTMTSTTTATTNLTRATKRPTTIPKTTTKETSRTPTTIPKTTPKETTKTPTTIPKIGTKEITKRPTTIPKTIPKETTKRPTTIPKTTPKETTRTPTTIPKTIPKTTPKETTKTPTAIPKRIFEETTMTPTMISKTIFKGTTETPTTTPTKTTKAPTTIPRNIPKRTTRQPTTVRTSIAMTTLTMVTTNTNTLSTLLTTVVPATTPTKQTTKMQPTVKTTMSQTPLPTMTAYMPMPTALVQIAECLVDVDDDGIKWNVTELGETRKQERCLDDYDGHVVRRCNENGIWEAPVKNCTRRKYAEIFKEIQKDKVNATEVLRTLVNITSESTDDNATLLAGDLQTLQGVLAGVTKSMAAASNEEIVENTQDFLSVASTLLGDSNTDSWKGVINTTGYGAEAVLNNIDMFVEKITNTSAENIVPQNISNTNILLTIGKVDDCQTGLTFPDRSGADTGVPDWARSNANNIQISCSKESKIRAFSTAMYKNIGAMIPAKLSGDKNGMRSSVTVNSAVMSMSYYPKMDSKLETPVTITFEAVNRSLVDPKCSFWEYDVSETSTGSSRPGAGGGWASDGCWLDSYSPDTGFVVCKCDHLTNFAIIMSPAGHVAEHHKALGAISMVGCSISMLALVLTVGVYAFYWRIVHGDRTLILMNLCVALFLAYLIFLAGIDKTSNKAVCTLVAVLLHFTFLSVFLLMLAEGLQTAYTILIRIKTGPIGVKLVLASYGMAALIVAMAMGGSGLEGYGNNKFCWLAVDSGLIWAFLAPALVVILVNIVIIVQVMKTLFSTVAMSKKTDKEKAKTAIRSTCVLLPVMGVTWIFGLFSVNSDTVVFQYLFAIFNSIQGVLIFIFHVVLNRKIQDSFMKTRQKYVPSESTALTEMSKSKSASETTSTMGKGHWSYIRTYHVDISD